MKIVANVRPAGYAALVERFDLTVMPNWHISFVSSGGVHRVVHDGDMVEETYPSSYWPGEGLGDHLEFALKYDGTNLATLAALFDAAGVDELLEYIRSKPTGKYARRLWFLYEYLTGKVMPLEDIAKRINYVDLLDPKEYYTVSHGGKVRRQRVNNNLPGDNRFCPMIRRSDELARFEERFRSRNAPNEFNRHRLEIAETKSSKRYNAEI